MIAARADTAMMRRCMGFMSLHVTAVPPLYVLWDAFKDGNNKLKLWPRVGEANFFVTRYNSAFSVNKQNKARGGKHVFP